MKRRVLLAGIGTASIGVGGAFGSGAFTSIEADRDVTLNVDNDANAQIIFRENADATGAGRLIGTDSSNAVDVIQFSQTNLNEQAETTFEQALEVVNNTDDSGPVSTDDDGLTVNLYVQERSGGGIGDGDTDVLDFRVDDDDSDGTRSIVQDSDGKNPVELPPTGGDGSDTAAIDIVVDLRNDDVNNSENDDKNDLDDITQVTFLVEAVDS